MRSNGSYWNGYVDAGASNQVLLQYQFQNGIVWAYEKSASGQGILHAYDATGVSHELWNSNMNSGRDAFGEGIGFATPVVVGGRVVVAYDQGIGIFGLLQY